MKMGIRMAVAFAATLAALGAGAQDKPCPPAEAAKAEKAADRVVNFDQLYKTWQEFGHCDTGAVDEIFTEAILRCIVEWKHVETLARPMEKDRPYRDFVHRHLGSPAAKADLDSIYSRAKMSCPKGLESFCTDITMSVRPFAGMEMIPSTADKIGAPGAEPAKK